MVNVWHALFGRGQRFKQMPTMNSQQQGLNQQLMSGLQGGQSNVAGMDYLNQLMSNDPNAFAAYEAPMMRQFNQEITPQIAEQFGGMGSGGALGSSAFQQQLAGAAGRLSQDLGAQRAGLRQGAMQQLMGLYGQAMNPQFMYANYGASPGMVQQALGGLAQGAGAGMGMGMGAGMGRMMGGYM